MSAIKWLVYLLLCLSFNNINAQCSCEPVWISHIHPEGLVIDSPGNYIFKKSILWNPTGDGQAILITANHVTLDLNGHTLKSVTTPYSTVGIVSDSASALVIKNGTVANMGLGGIKCNNGAEILIRKLTVDGLNMENTTTYTVPVGILVDSSMFVSIEKCIVKNIKVKTGSTAAIQLTETTNSSVKDCLVKHLLNKDGACTGIGHLLCDVAEVKSCTLDGLKSEFIDNLNTEGHTTIGIVPVASTNLKIENCDVSNIIGCCDDAHGMSIFECLNAEIKNCRVENVIDGTGSTHTGAKATGIEVYASGVNVSQCTAKNIKAINPQDKQATGFSCAQCIGVNFIECLAENVCVVDEHGKHNPCLGYGTGFGWAPDPRPEFIVPAVGTLFRECTAKKCQVGFDSWFQIDSVWEDIYSICNDIPILNQSNSSRTLSCNPCSECGCLQTGCYPTPRTVTITNVAGNNTFIDVHTKTCKDR